MASKKAGSTTKTNRDSISKRLGVKRFGDEKVTVGDIIIRQKGSRFHSGVGTKQGNDFTIYASTPGKVKFIIKKGKNVVTVYG